MKPKELSNDGQALAGQTQVLGTPPPPLDEEAFCRIAEIAEAEAGLDLPATKRAMVAARLDRRLGRLSLRSYDEYIALISDPAARERKRMVAALTTNISRFFREAHHFAFLKQQVLPDLLARAKSGGRVRLWSAGCANGQEAVSLAITLLEVCPNAADLDIRILGTDIDPSVIRFAQLGTYHTSMLAGLNPTQIAHYFDQDVSARSARIAAPLGNLLLFRELNLHGHWPMPGQFDIIFCRNVVIYFSEVRQIELWRRFHGKLIQGGILCVGHSERIPETEQFQLNPGCQTAYWAT